MADESKVVDREDFSSIFYGTGPVPPPWATDCPVKFEVWLKYAQQPRGQAVDLILALGEQHVVADVFNHIRIFAAAGLVSGNRRPVLSGGYIAVELTFEELIAIVLPLTSLGRKIGSARDVVRDNGGNPTVVLATILSGADFQVSPDSSVGTSSEWETAQIGYRSVERREHQVDDPLRRYLLALPGLEFPP
jgi:hypothetical protein